MTKEGKIKLFVDAHVFDKEFQGTQTFVRGLYKSLLEKYSSELEIYFGVNDVDKFSANLPFVSSSRILKYKKNNSNFLRLFTEIPYYIKKHQFDFAHFQNISLQKKSRCKTIITLHDIIFNDFPDEFPFIYRNARNLLFRRSINRAAIKTSVSAYSRDRISCQYKILPEHIHVVPNAANYMLSNCDLSKKEASFEIAKKFGIENFILCVSRIEPRKNHLLLLEKYLKLELFKKNIPLVFVGKKSIDVSHLNKRINELTEDQKKMFYWYEQVSQEDLIKLYKACKLFVYPSKAEGFGIPPLEAITCGAPVLCSNVSAMKDYYFFQPYTFDPDDEKDFERKLNDTIHNLPDENFIKNAADEVFDNYSWQHSADIFYKLLNSGKQCGN
ncbi:MAG TPA: glycosyltransferase family 1 protein [Puia sp.]|jgi:glycosyltransferase involved in cell wall biosynthesis|nr:glycosyltransferase family 1 protein [Puia sp.]